MEHRCSVRKPIEFQLILYKHGLPVQSGICRNLGLGGMFIEAGTYLWRKNEYLEVEIAGINAHAGMRLPAVVVHHCERGAGLMFDAMSSEQRSTLRTWLFGGTVEDQPAAAAAAVTRGSRAVA